MGKKINILQVAKSSGGVGVYVERLVKALNKDDFHITVACLSEGADQLAADLSSLQGVTAVAIPMAHNIDPFSDFRVLLKLAQLIRRGNFDLIHAHTSKPGFFARISAIGTHIPVIYQPHAFAFHEGSSKWKAGIYAAIERLNARFLTKKIITVCNEEKERAIFYRIAKNNTQLITILTGIELDPFKLARDRTVVREELGLEANAILVGAVGRLVEQKAPFDFIKMASQVGKLHPEIQFVWIGDGPLIDDARKLVKSFNLQDAFHFIGHRKDVPSILTALDYFILSSHWEGFSLAVLEAMAAGLPVVSTQVTGAAEAIVVGETGYLAPVGDVGRLVELLISLVENPEMAKGFGDAARKRVADYFSHSRMVNEIQDLYIEVYNGFA